MNGIGVDTVVADPLLAVHVLAGVVALGAGLAAMATAKGRARHNAAGRAYVASMGVVVVTALPLAVRIDSAFLLAVAVFSGYLVFAGYREVRRRQARLTDPAPADWAGHGTMVAVGAAMVVLGVHGTVTGTVELAPVLAVFGAIGGGAAGFTLRRFRTPLADRTPWIERHIGFMGGAYIATVTAAVTVNLTAVPPLARWLGPTLVGVPLIVYATRRYRPRFAPTA